MSETIIEPCSTLPLLQGEGRGEDGFDVGPTKPIPTLILPRNKRIPTPAPPLQGEGKGRGWVFIFGRRLARHSREHAEIAYRKGGRVHV